MRPLLIGEAPGRAAVLPGGRCGRRLAELAGVDDLAAAFRIRNLLDRWPGPDGTKGSAFDVGDARRLAAELRSPGPWILLGLRVAAAMEVRAPYLRWTWARGRRVAILPHPSGVNRWWNNAANAHAAARFLRRSLGA